MIKPENIKSIINEALRDSNFFPVETVVTPAGKITVYIDSMKGVTIDDCAEVSRFIESRLDRSNQDYELEVSSPGPERSLLLPIQYHINKGRKLDILGKDGIRHRGKLIDLNGNRIILETEQQVKDEESGKKIKRVRNIEIAMDQVKKAKIIISK
ncbi:MAG: ribosome assembly cofactor RimP [Bacteroidales bacterium]|nr:ribosome assembly cofactor RimP [Bacteroidales bacterium]